MTTDILFRAYEYLYKALTVLGDVTIVAPDRERSGISHSITLNEPLRVEEERTEFDNSLAYHVNGTPADCVKIGLNQILNTPPDLVISGINRGANTGSNILYSGTVAGAAEGALAGIPALAVSRDSFDSQDFNDAARISVLIASRILSKGLPKGIVLNVNIPHQKKGYIRGITITRQGNRFSRDIFLERKDPRQKPYFWLKAQQFQSEEDHATDEYALGQGYVSVTPLQLNRTDSAGLSLLNTWDWILDSSSEPAIET